MGNLGGVGSGMHQQKVELRDVRNNKSLVSGRHHVLGGLVGTVSDLGHADGTSESTSHARVDTLGLSPRLTNTGITVGVMASKLLGVLLDDLRMGSGSGHC